MKMVNIFVEVQKAPELQHTYAAHLQVEILKTTLQHYFEQKN